jgi:hypothetical protein
LGKHKFIKIEGKRENEFCGFGSMGKRKNPEMLIIGEQVKEILYL